MIKRVASLSLGLTLAALIFVFLAPAALAVDLPSNIDIPGNTEVDTFPFNLLQGLEIGDAATTSQIIILLTILVLAPSILIMLTGFTRIIIILSFMRNAMGTMQVPPNQVLIGLALFLTFFVMWPVFENINDNALGPYERGEITYEEAVDRTVKPVREFMYEQIRIQGNENSLRTFVALAEMEQPENIDDIPTHVLIPAFITSEIKTAFKLGFLIFLPFVVIDMIVASTLMSMGMMMLPPVMIALPFKIMLFVLVDGWNLTINTLILTFRP